MLEEFQSIWDGQLDQINMLEHRIYLESQKNRPVCSVTYRTGTKETEFEKNNISKIIKICVIKPETTE